MKKIVILGAGISGLSLGWFLKKKHGSTLNLQILEKTSRPGGWIQTQQVQDTLFDQGPRSCRIRGHGLETLKLIEELGLSHQVLPADRAAKKRYIYTDKTLKALPGGWLSLFTSPWTAKLIQGLVKDLTTPKSPLEDETIHSFFSRRFNPEMAETFIDPLTLGIYAGNIRQLSIRSCYPDWFEREQQYGGLLKSLWKKSSSPLSMATPFIDQMKKHSIFTLRHGMESLIQALSHQMHSHIMYQAEAVSLYADQKKGVIKLRDGTQIDADYICSTLPAYVLGQLLQSRFPDLADFPLSIPHASVAVVNIGYYEKMHPYSGFGYLVPSKEKEKILGTVWDSSIFSEQNGSFKNRMSMMFGGAHHPEIDTFSEEAIIDLALKALKHHLGITKYPNSIHVKKAFASIPQFLLGHHHRKGLFIKELADKFPHLSLLGMAFHGVSVNDCIVHAKLLSENLLRV